MVVNPSSFPYQDCWHPGPRSLGLISSLGANECPLIKNNKFNLLASDPHLVRPFPRATLEIDLDAGIIIVPTGVGNQVGDPWQLSISLGSLDKHTSPVLAISEATITTLSGRWNQFGSTWISHEADRTLCLNQRQAYRGICNLDRHFVSCGRD